MTEDKSLQKSTGKENQPVNENGKKKSKEDKPPTKIVVRRLPPSMTEDQFKMQVAPLPDFDYFYFVSADKSLSPNAFCRAYINFLDQNDLFTFTQKFDGYVFLDSKGGEFPAVVEFAPFQRIPKNRPHRKKDPKIGTIEADPIFVAFKEQLEAENLEKKASGNVSKQHFFETSLIQEKKESVCTPLLDFVKFKRAERQRIRDEKREEKRKKDLERRRAKEEQKRTKKDEETSVVKTPPDTHVSEIQKLEDSNKETEITNCKLDKDDTLLLNEQDHVDLTKIKEDTSLPVNKSENPQVIQKVQDLVNFFNTKKVEPKSSNTTGFNPVPIVTTKGKIFLPQSSHSKVIPYPNAMDIILKPKPVGVNPLIHLSKKKILKYQNAASTHKEIDMNRNIRNNFSAICAKNLARKDISKHSVYDTCLSKQNLKKSSFNSVKYLLPPKAVSSTPNEEISYSKEICNSKIKNTKSCHYNDYYDKSEGRVKVFKMFNKLPPFSQKSIGHSNRMEQS